MEMVSISLTCYSPRRIHTEEVPHIYMRTGDELNVNIIDPATLLLLSFGCDALRSSFLSLVGMLQVASQNPALFKPNKKKMLHPKYFSSLKVLNNTISLSVF